MSVDQENVFQEHQIVPDVLPRLPADLLQVMYNCGEVDPAAVLTPTEVMDIPIVAWGGDPEKYYTLLKVDPDAPSRAAPKFREWQHWIVGNIPGVDISKGETLAEYVGAGAPKGTGRHRYVFVVYQQPGKLTFDELRLDNHSGKNRGKFSTKDFATKYNLGDPFAANFYFAEWDEHVPNLFNVRPKQTSC